MHTFFINTSERKQDDYPDVFEILNENRSLISLDCLISEWHDEEKGYKACVRKIGELIDNYKDINNDFNLIIYVDLLVYKIYTDISSKDGQRERYACLEALRTLINGYIRKTLINELSEVNGRTPNEILIIFEENKRPESGDNDEEGKKLIRDYAVRLIDFPDEQKLADIVIKDKNDLSDVISYDDFCRIYRDNSSPQLDSSLLPLYKQEIGIMLEEVKENKDLTECIGDLISRMLDFKKQDLLKFVSFETNRRVGVNNKKENTHCALRLAFYLIECAESGKLFIEGESHEKKAREFRRVNWDKTAEILEGKKAFFEKKYKEAENCSKSFSDPEVGLAPKLYTLDNNRFALDTFGNRAKKLVTVDADKEKTEKEKDNDVEEGLIRRGNEKEAVVKEEERRSLFTAEEYPPFDYTGEKFDDGDLNTKTEFYRFEEKAKELRKHHLDYLNKLKEHVTERLSAYAGRSYENKPALLRKRRVSISNDDLKDDAKDYIYTGGAKTEEKRSLNTVKEVARKAYETTFFAYVEFCAGRSVALTDIEEECNWFLTRIAEIRASLRKIGAVTIGLIFALLVLYIPFVVIQWEAITQNAMTAVIALVSIITPLILLSIIAAAAVKRQRRKIYEAWNEFKDRSDKVLAKNTDAVKKYDQLLTVYIPALRWVYEYKLDVEFYEDCCNMARAKIKHHTDKLRARVNTVANIIEDLEITGKPGYREIPDYKIDYSYSYCSGENRKAYSIIDTDFIEDIYE